MKKLDIALWNIVGFSATGIIISLAFKSWCGFAISFPIFSFSGFLIVARKLSGVA